MLRKQCYQSVIDLGKITIYGVITQSVDKKPGVVLVLLLTVLLAFIILHYTLYYTALYYIL